MQLNPNQKVVLVHAAVQAGSAALLVAGDVVYEFLKTQGATAFPNEAGPIAIAAIALGTAISMLRHGASATVPLPYPVDPKDSAVGQAVVDVVAPIVQAGSGPGASLTPIAESAAVPAAVPTVAPEDPARAP